MTNSQRWPSVALPQRLPHPRFWCQRQWCPPCWWRPGRFCGAAWSPSSYSPRWWWRSSSPRWEPHDATCATKMQRRSEMQPAGFEVFTPPVRRSSLSCYSEANEIKGGPFFISCTVISYAVGPHYECGCSLMQRFGVSYICCMSQMGLSPGSSTLYLVFHSGV